MAKPTLTAAEIALLENLKAQQEELIASLEAQETARAARNAKLEEQDESFKKFFDWYNDSIIGQYDKELKAITGEYQVNPIVEADIVACAELNTSGRLTPSLPSTDPIRIDEFDQDNLIQANSNYEELYIDAQADLEDALANGYGNPTGFNGTTVTTSTLNSNSTSLTISDNTGPTAFQTNEVYIVTNGSLQAAIKVTNVNETTNPPAMTPYTYTLTIQVVVPPSSSIGTGAGFIAFTGFSNSDRTSKTATLQNLLDQMIAALEDAITNRISTLDIQLDALGDNEDPDATTAIASATTQANTSKTFLNNYLITTDISNTGLSSLATERGVRLPQAQARALAIKDAYTDQTINYLDRRYELAVARANTAIGTLRLLKVSESVESSSNNYKTLAEQYLASIEDLLEE